MSRMTARFADQLTESIEENRRLRELLAIAHSGARLYTDDGELQDNSQLPPIDFMRDSVADIESKIKQRGAYIVANTDFAAGCISTNDIAKQIEGGGYGRND